jgi:solute carrier family 25 carnitine/acylcarnitine transporter 20/29
MEGFLQDLIAGTVGGVCGIVVGQPADTVKVRLQTSNAYKGAFDCAALMLRKEGIRSFFKGILAPIVANGPINATIFVVYGNAIRAGTDHYRNEVQLSNRTLNRNTPVVLPASYHFLAGSLGGLMQCVFACPNELIKIKQQLQCAPGEAERSSWQVARQAVRESGIRRGLFQGFGLTAARDVPAFGIYFCSYEWSKTKMMNQVRSNA